MKRSAPPRIGQTNPTRPPITPEEFVDIADLILTRQSARRMSLMSCRGRLRHWGGQ